MKEKYTSYNDSRIYYRVAGTGFPVVLLHGFGEDGNIWNHQVDHLKNNYQLIIPDLPGSGKSDFIDIPGTGLETYADVIKQILESENLARVAMIGHSMGGYITLAYVEKYPENLSAFGLFHSSAYKDDEAKVDTRKKAIDFIRSHGSEAFLKTSIPNLFYDQQNSGPINNLVNNGKNFLPQALIQYYEAMIARPDRTIVLHKTSLPVLFIMGEHDKAVPFNHSLEQSHIPETSQIHILRNSAHMGMLEETAKANGMLASFLANYTD